MLVVEMNSGSRVIVTLPTVDELRAIAGRIVDAIDNPAAEFTAIVRRFNSRHTNNYGPVVNMNGGRENIGVNYAGTAGDMELRVAVGDLTGLLRDLRPHLAPDQDRAVGDAPPELVADRDALRERGIVLASLAQIAATVGEVGRPAVDAVGRLLALLG